MPITRRLRAVQAERYMPKTMKRHIDVGCGDGYFLKRSWADERHGHDELYGDKLSDLSQFPDNHFDCVTLLAVLEHFDDPDIVRTEVFRILKPKGRLIMTTPRKAAHGLISMYSTSVGHEHKHYYDKRSLDALASGLYTFVDYRTFLFGMNQVVCFEKP